MKIKSVLFFILILLFGINSNAQSEYKDRIHSILTFVELEGEVKIKATIDSLELALSIATEKEDLELEVVILSSLQRQMIFLFSDYENAAEYSERLYELAKNNTHTPLLLAIYHNSLGMLYYHEMVDKHKAFNEFEKALTVLKDNSLQLDYHFLNNYAIAFMQDGKQDQAIELLHKARSCFEIYPGFFKNPLYPYTNALNLGVSYIYDHQPDSAEYYFKEALFFATQNLNKSKIFSANVYLGVFYQENGRYDDAISYLETADSLVTYGNSYAQKIILYEAFSELYFEQNDFKLAFEYSVKVNNYKDSLRVKRIDDKVIAFEYKLELEAFKAKKTIELADEKLSQTAFVKKITIIVAVLIISLLLILFFLFRVVKQKEINEIRAKNEYLEKVRIKQQAELDLTKKEEQLISANVELSIRGSELNSLKQNLKIHLDKSHDPQFDDLRKFLNQIKYSEKKNNQLKNIDAVVSVNSSKFYAKLKSLHPDLTENEMRLLTLIRLNLSSDELLLIYNISKSSLNTKRYRIRKKIGLTPKDSLEEFIMSI